MLSQLKAGIASGAVLQLLDASGNQSDIVGASTLSIGGENFSLDDDTEFVLEGTPVKLRIVFQCWLHKDSDAATYLEDCSNKGLSNLSFLQRTDLVGWLNGTNEESQYIGASGAHDDATAGKHVSTSVDGELAEIYARERALVDHNSFLKGSKPTSFGYLIRESEIKLVNAMKGKKQSKGVTKPTGMPSKKKGDPIILISSAASALFTISNIKQFLENGQYVPSTGGDSGLTTIVRDSERFGKVKFLVVNNTRNFTKPEYWDRVIAIFTTGHQWQFESYKWTQPTELFNKIKGYYFHFSGDNIPPAVASWSVEKIQLDKNKRFKDVEVARYFWNSLEKEMLSKGYGRM